jgi:hypothetical protein
VLLARLRHLPFFFVIKIIHLIVICVAHVEDIIGANSRPNENIPLFACRGFDFNRSSVHAANSA